MAVLVGILVSLLVAFAVLILAGVAAGSGAPGEERNGPLRAFRAGWAARKHPDADQTAAAAAAAVRPVDVSLDEFLRATADEGDPYLQVDDLADTLQRASRKAARALPRQRGA
ncbi:hypothetical protein [Cellulomonas fimi]|uniref:hypothetical protein n=1 Tax=Cellulomonas fimi TaxID=1708 RepID=UPI00235A0C88|nr:hypothetical protein [Cellulomonas fimi]